MDILIRLDEGTKCYGGIGRPALDGIGLEVAVGDAVAIMGPSDSGKSTLLNLVAGLDRLTRDQVTVAGRRMLAGLLLAGLLLVAVVAAGLIASGPAPRATDPAPAARAG